MLRCRIEPQAEETGPKKETNWERWLYLLTHAVMGDPFTKNTTPLRSKLARPPNGLLLPQAIPP